jgi:hypothetical protein
LIYLDTSVLVAYYCPEALSQKAERVIRSQLRSAISDLTEVEMNSALSRKTRHGELSRNDAQQVVARFSGHIEGNFYTRIAIERAHYTLARDWLGRFTTSLRTLDALHLAVAALERRQLVTADRTVARSAEAFGVKVDWLSAEASPG